MNYPQIIVVMLLALNVAIEIKYDGERRIAQYDAAKTILAALVEVALLNWGGFFDCWIK